MKGLTQLAVAIVVTALGSAPARTQPLTAEDANSWLDGLMPYAMSAGEIAGGVVVVVKDGQVLTERGFGYANVAEATPMDPRETLVRPGSISKLFTWTAVMQLVEQGRLALDQDVNRYIDFAIPPLQGRPITLRNIMTHTAGFEESLKDIDTNLPPQPLAEYVRSHLPRRIYPPGVVPAYSNYATALAGYIVARSSGMSFDDYVEQHILIPLRMKHSSFHQPVAAELRSRLSNGYRLASQPPEYFEFLAPTPAGALSATADDMARFMIAHLQKGSYDGARVLSEDSAVLMHASQPKIYPALNGMALGFYETSRNGHRVIAHNGGTQFFHSDLHLFVDDGVGIFISLNSAGSDDVASRIHDALFHGFADRYFPGTAAVDRSPGLATAVEHARLMAGDWENSRRSDSTFMSLVGLLSPMTITANADGTISLPVPSHGMMSWREVAPFVWRQVDGAERIQALVADGRPVMLGFGMAPPAAFLPIPSWRSPAWLVPALLVSVTVLLLTGLSWPLGAITRRIYGVNSRTVSRALLIDRATRAASLAQVAVLFTFLATLGFLSADTSRLSAASDGWLLGLQGLAAIIVPGAMIVSLCNVLSIWRERRAWASRLWSVLGLASCCVTLLTCLVFHLLRLSTHY